MVKCSNCVFSDLVAKLGESFYFTDPIGNEKLKIRENDVIICRANPPHNGWPIVTESDWCGNFNPGEEVLATI